MKRFVLFLLVIALSPILNLQAQETSLGATTFENSGDQKAQDDFLEGLLLLHSFEYDDAREAFQRAQSIDPDFAMAYWGEAMTHNHPIWRQKYKEPARAALSKLGATLSERLDKAPTEREKAYLKAVELLFAEGPKLKRDKSYAAQMKTIYDRYPDDLDAGAFYALSLLGTSHGQRDFDIYMRAAAVVEDVFAKNPNHPGAAHYLIHAYDDPVHAPLGLRAAKSYARIAPSAAHALHMPSHIFVAMGMWEASSETNAASYRASVERATRKGIPVEHHHALSWLIYDYLQQGLVEKARETLDTMIRDLHLSNVNSTRFHYAVMRAVFIMETGMWDTEPAEIKLKTGDNTSVAVLMHFADGYSAAKRGDVSAAKKHRDVLNSIVENGTASTWVATANIAKMEIDALLLHADGRTDDAIAILREATQAESEMEFSFGPPRTVKPSYELLGDMLLAINDFEGAVATYQKTLERHPGRAKSLLGLARSAQKAGNNELAQQAFEQLKENWRNADKGLLEQIPFE